jgi:hypothetical protein
MNGLAAGFVNPTFSATNVIVRVARMQSGHGLPVSESSPLGTSMASTGTFFFSIASFSAGNGSRGALGEAVPKMASTIKALVARARDHFGGRHRPREAHALRDLPIDQRVALKARGVEEEADLDVHVAVVQVAGHRQPVAAVVAAAAEDQHGHLGAAIEHLPGDVGRGAGGVLHQHDAGNAVALDGAAVDLRAPARRSVDRFAMHPRRIILTARCSYC